MDCTDVAQILKQLTQLVHAYSAQKNLKMTLEMKRNHTQRF